MTMFSPTERRRIRGALPHLNERPAHAVSVAEAGDEHGSLLEARAGSHLGEFQVDDNRAALCFGSAVVTDLSTPIAACFGPISADGAGSVRVESPVESRGLAQRGGDGRSQGVGWQRLGPYGTALSSPEARGGIGRDQTCGEPRARDENGDKPGEEGPPQHPACARRNSVVALRVGYLSFLPWLPQATGWSNGSRTSLMETTGLTEGHRNPVGTVVRRTATSHLHHSVHVGHVADALVAPRNVVSGIRLRGWSPEPWSVRPACVTASARPPSHDGRGRARRR